jgi:hypothetical protein
MVAGLVCGPRRVRPAFWGGCGKWWFSRVGGCLLACCWVLRQHVVLFLGVVFENCRVDASIFVVKFLWAHGGCLGIRSR